MPELLLPIGALVLGTWIGYVNAEDRSEETLLMKLVGYALLGFFTFRLNYVPLPLGFGLALWLSSRAAFNVRARRAAAITTFVYWLLSLFLF